MKSAIYNKKSQNEVKLLFNFFCLISIKCSFKVKKNLKLRLSNFLHFLIIAKYFVFEFLEKGFN